MSDYLTDGQRDGHNKMLPGVNVVEDEGLVVIVGQLLLHRGLAVWLHRALGGVILWASLCRYLEKTYLIK